VVKKNKALSIHSSERTVGPYSQVSGGDKSTDFLVHIQTNTYKQYQDLWFYLGYP